MLTVFAALAVVALGAVTFGVRARRRRIPVTIGWMSEQWLAECRASHPS